MSQEDDDLKLEKPSVWAPTPESRLYEALEKITERVKVNDQESRQRDDERQRRIDFILEQQAQLAADMQQFAAGMEQLREAQARAEEKWGGMWERTNAGINALLAAAEIQAQEIAGLAQAQTNTDRQMAETTEKLNALINVVEKSISERRNGG